MDSFRALLDVIQPVAIAAMAFVVAMDLTGNKMRPALFIALIVMSFFMAVDKPSRVTDAAALAKLAEISNNTARLLAATKGVDGR